MKKIPTSFRESLEFGSQPFAFANHTHPPDYPPSVADIDARDAFAPNDRYDGLMVYVESDQTTYQLRGGVSNDDWSVWANATGASSHLALGDIGTNTHAQIDTHLADTATHFTMAEISITTSQISDYAEVNDLSAAVTWANVPDANITESSVTQHQAALAITTGQVTGANHSLFYSNAAGVLTALPLGSAGQFLRSTGNTSTPTWDAYTSLAAGIDEEIQINVSGAIGAASGWRYAGGDIEGDGGLTVAGEAQFDGDVLTYDIYVGDTGIILGGDGDPNILTITAYDVDDIVGIDLIGEDLTNYGRIWASSSGELELQANASAVVVNSQFRVDHSSGIVVNNNAKIRANNDIYGSWESADSEEVGLEFRTSGISNIVGRIKGTVVAGAEEWFGLALGSSATWMIRQHLSSGGVYGDLYLSTHTDDVWFFDESAGTHTWYSGSGINKTAHMTLSAAGLLDVTDLTINGTTLSLTYAPLSHTHTAAEIISGTFLDGLIQESNVTQHEAALTITESQISDLGTTVAMVADNLSVFAATTSAQLAGVISDETGSGALVFGTSPTLVTPNLGTPSTLVLTNATGLPEAQVTQHEGALTITESQISDLGSYLPLTGGTITGDLTVTGDVIVEAAQPEIWIKQTGAALDQGDWVFQGNGEALFLKLVDDANSNTTDVMQVLRSGTGASMNVDDIFLNSDDIFFYNGAGTALRHRFGTGDNAYHQINGALAGSPVLEFQQNSTTKAYLQYRDSGDEFWVDSDGDMLWRPGNVPKMKLDTGGALELGRATGSPSLDLNGEATADLLIQMRQNGTQRAYLQYQDSGDIFRIDSDGTITLASANTTALTIDTSQNATFAGSILNTITVEATAAGSPAINLNQGASTRAIFRYLDAGDITETLAGSSYRITTNSSTALTIDSSQDAIFASDVTVTGNITSTGTQATLGNFVFNIDQTVGVGQDNYVLTYDDSSGEIGLEAASGGGGSSTLDALTDTTITSIASGEILKWNGSAWINNTLAEAGIAATSHTHAASDITSGTFADARIAASNVTQHQASLSITESQISDLGSYANLSGSTSQDFSVDVLTLANNETTDVTAGGDFAYDYNDSSPPATLGTYADTHPLGLYIGDGTYVSRVWHDQHFTGTHVANWQTAYGWGDHSGLYLPLSGGSLSGALDMGNNDINNIGSTGIDLEYPTGDYGSIQVSGAGKGAYEGFSIAGRVVFMENGSGNSGLYDDVNNSWMVRGDLGSFVRLYYAGAQKLETYSGGVTITGTLNGTSAVTAGTYMDAPEIREGGTALEDRYLRLAGDTMTGDLILASGVDLHFNGTSGPHLDGTSGGYIDFRNSGGSGGIRMYDSGGNLDGYIYHTSGYIGFLNYNGSWAVRVLNTWVRLAYNGSTKLQTSSSGITVTGTGSATDWTATSDIRLKSNIRLIDNALDKIAELRGCTFDKIGEENRTGGLIAQELREVLPEAIKEDEEGYLTVSPAVTIGLLVEGIKELRAEIAELKRQ